MKNLVLLGAPGSGKGTQSAKLTTLGYEHVSTGNLLRNEISKQTKLGLKVKSVMDSGQLVSDDLVVELLKANLDLNNYSYIFDGYPRNIEQAKTLSTILDTSEYTAVYFELNIESLVERLKNRRMTKDGKYIYNLLSNSPKIDGVCDVSGEKLIQRDDDKEEVVRSRMKVFENTIEPVLAYYEAKNCLVRVNADHSVETVYKDIVSKIK